MEMPRIFHFTMLPFELLKRNAVRVLVQKSEIVIFNCQIGKENTEITPDEIIT